MSTCADQFAGIRLKLSRAWNQINGLKPDVEAFLENDPAPYVPRVNFNGQTHVLTVSVHIQKAPDPMWGVRIGEIIHNLRSALDHLIWELVILNTRQPPPIGNKNQFPIFEYEVGFSDRGIKQFLRGVSPAAIALIKSEQPFPGDKGGTGEGAKSPLWHLKELSDVDKHRTLHVTGTLLESFNFTFPPLTRDATIQRQERRGPGPIQEDTVLASAYLPGVIEWPFAERQVQCTLGTDVAFDQGTPTVGGWLVFDTLVDITNRTERILARIGKDIFKTEL